MWVPQKTLSHILIRFAEVEQYGADNPVEEEPPSASTIATICFSRLSPIKNSPESKPKGVMLSHEVKIAFLVSWTNILAVLNICQHVNM